MSKEIKIGILTIVTIALAIWGFKFISGQKLLSGDKTFYTTVTNAKEINTATKVLVNGYQVGGVTSINPDPDNVKIIRVGFQVSKNILLPDYTVVEIRAESPLGGKEFSLNFDKFCSGGNCAENGYEFKSEEMGLLGSIISEDELNPHINSITTSIDKTLGKLGDPNSSAPLDKTIRDVSATMENMASSTEKFANLMTRSSKNIEITMANMAVLTDALVNSNEKLASVLNDVSKITTDLSKASLSETVSKSNATIDQANSSLKSLESTMNEANVMVKELNKLVSSMGNEEGTLGMLLNDKKLYTELQSSTRNMNLLLRDIRLNPRRYLKVFGKKVPDYKYEEDPAGEKQ